MVGFSSAESMEEGAALALDVLARYSQAEAGFLLRATGGRMQVLAHVGLQPGPERRKLLGIDQPYPEGLAWRAIQTGSTQFAPMAEKDGAPPGGAVTALHPIGWRDTFRYVLILRYFPPSQVTPADLDLFSAVTTQMQHGLERLQSDMVQDRLLILQAKIVDAASSDLFQLILDEALALVPGAGAGSLLVRKNSSLPFRFRAVSGFDMTELRDVELSEAHIRNWYGRQADSWRNGEPRELRRSVMSLDQLSGRSSEQTDGLPGTRLIQSSLCLPVSFRGEVLACLNLDNLQDEKAFAEDSIKVLRQFAPVISNLIGAASHFDRIVGLAHTDALTGLPNRRGGVQALDALLQDSRHGDGGFALLSLDLTGFKQVNDLYGHESGDEALIDVAAALSSAARSGDTVVRWGGDEFIVILPGADRSTGEHVARRLREAVSGIRAGEVRLGISIGVAVFPDDAEDASRLLQLADARMYMEKQEQGRRR